MKKSVLYAVIFSALALGMTGCFTPKEEAAFNGTWKLIAIGADEVPGKPITLDIRNMLIYEDDKLAGGIYHEGDKFFLQEVYKLTAYPCLIQEDPGRTLLIIRTPENDEAFNGNDLIYVKTSK